MSTKQNLEFIKFFYNLHEKLGASREAIQVWLLLQLQICLQGVAQYWEIQIMIVRQQVSSIGRSGLSCLCIRWVKILRVNRHWLWLVCQIAIQAKILLKRYRNSFKRDAYKSKQSALKGRKNEQVNNVDRVSAASYHQISKGVEDPEDIQQHLDYVGS